MTLSTLIRGKRESGEVATAISAISAIPSAGSAAKVARIATVAVANRTVVKAEPTRPLGYQLDGGIGEGFREWELFHLPENDKRKILIIIARIAEATYRRGAHHGWSFCVDGQKLKIPLDKLRFGTESLDSARMPLCGTRMASLKRLSIQHGSALAALGFDSIHDDIQ